MNPRIFARIGSLVLIFLLSVYFVQNPIFEEFDISKHEGETIPVYFTKITGKAQEGYIVETGIEKTHFEVIIDEEFRFGEIVTFYGTIKNSRIIVQKTHRHAYPDVSYYLSLIGLVVFLWVMKREGD